MAKVCLARSKDTNRLSALKAISRSDIIRQKMRKHIFEERDILKHLSTQRYDSDGPIPFHPFIAKMQSSFTTSSYVFFALEFYPGGDLENLLRQMRCFNAALTHFYAMELVSALEYLHEQSIVHRDLKPANILLDREGHIILTDFGMSKRFFPGSPKDNICCGTRPYICPEMYELEEYSYSPDWWSLGIVIFEMLTGHVPFRRLPYEPSSVLEEKIRVEDAVIPKKLPKNTRHFIRKLLKRNPNSRLSGDNVKKHPYFLSVDWSKVLAKEYTPPYVPTVDETLTVAPTSFLDTDETLAQINVVRKSPRSENSKNNDHYGGFYHAEDGLSGTSSILV